MMNTIKNIAKTAERAINEPTDYLNEVDNLMYCGKCHTPKLLSVKLKAPLSGILF